MKEISTFHTVKLRFIDFTKVVQDVQKADYEFSGTFTYLKHHLSNFVEVVFSMPRKHKMSSRGLSSRSNIALSTLSKFF
jgi:hypothetical protein